MSIPGLAGSTATGANTSSGAHAARPFCSSEATSMERQRQGWKTESSIKPGRQHRRRSCRREKERCGRSQSACESVWCNRARAQCTDPRSGQDSRNGTSRDTARTEKEETSSSPGNPLPGGSRKTKEELYEKPMTDHELLFAQRPRTGVAPAARTTRAQGARRVPRQHHDHLICEREHAHRERTEARSAAQPTNRLAQPVPTTAPRQSRIVERNAAEPQNAQQ